MSALAELIDAGLTLRTDGDRLIVTPASALTELLRQRIREEKPALLESVRSAEALSGALTNAINRTCDARGDDSQNRAGLIAECGRLPPRGQIDMLEHFGSQAAIWMVASADHLFRSEPVTDADPGLAAYIAAPVWKALAAEYALQEIEETPN